MIKEWLIYLSIMTLTYPWRWMPLSWLRCQGKWVGLALYYCYPNYRKRITSNLALATDLQLSPDRLLCLTKKNLQNLAITCLELVKLTRMTTLDSIVDLVDLSGWTKEDYEKKGAIFVCPHQANWELFFLQGSLLFPITGIGKPFNNRFLYQWIKQIRERFGGQLFPPDRAVKECLRALKHHHTVGLIADQATPSQGTEISFFGRKRSVTTLPALLAYKTSTPLFPATLSREGKRYRMEIHPPFIPRTDVSLEDEVMHLTRGIFHIFEKSIHKHPEEWLWVHNCYKQDPRGHVHPKYRFESILVILPQSVTEYRQAIQACTELRHYYPKAFFTCMQPRSADEYIPIEGAEVRLYDTKEELFLKDYRFKLVLNFTEHCALSKHFLKLSAFYVIDFCKSRTKYRCVDFRETLHKILQT